MRHRLMVRVLDLLSRLPGCGFIGWALLGVAVSDAVSVCEWCGTQHEGERDTGKTYCPGPLTPCKRA